MPATRYLVTLHPVGALTELARVETNLDRANDTVLRETMESLVKGHRGTLQVDLSRYRIRVRGLGRDGAPSTVWCWCGVTPAGRTWVVR